MSSTPLVFFHGFLGTGRDWTPVLSYLPNATYLCPNLPGHGTDFDPDAFFSSLPKCKFHLIGYSLGGRLAMAYASLYPEQVDRLILISTHPGLSSEDERNKRLAHDMKWAALLEQIPLADFLKLWYGQEIFAGFEPDLKDRLRHDPHLLAKALVHYSLAKQPVYAIERALHIVGENDHKFKKLRPQADVIPNAGHMVHLEQPKLVALSIQQKVHI